MNKRKQLVVAVALAGISAVSESYAAELEEIVVTARQRAESLQDVPLSETAFTAQQIEDAKIDKAGDFIAMTPNVTLAEAQSAGTSFMTIRGISQVRNGESPVATVVDGVLQINSRQFTQELFDVQQIEVLRGPQGAIYGRNATGGAILITTKQPTNETEGFIRVGAGKGSEKRIQGAVSGALVDDEVMYRLAGSWTDRDGYIPNDYLGEKADPFEDTTFRGLLKWNVSDALTADLRVNLVRTESGALNYQYQPAQFDPENPCFTTDDLLFANFAVLGAVSADAVNAHVCANNSGISERDIDEVSLKFDYDLGFATLTSITSTINVTEYAAGDQFPYSAATNLSSGFVDGTQTQYVDVDATSQELRLTSNGDGALDWMVGAYYLQTDRFISTTTGADNRLGIERIERGPKFDSAINPTLTYFADDNNNTAWAVFGSVNYNVTDALEASLAVRYDKDERDQQVSEDNTGGEPGANNTAEYDKWQPKFSLRYRLSDDTSIYGSWGIGFRSGQFNQNGVAAVAEGAGVNGVADSVDQEETETLELGFKSELLDGRVRLNGSVFDTTVDNSQYFVFIGEVGAQVLVNIGEVDIRGGEIELLAQVADGLDVYAGYGITDSEIKDYATNPAVVGNDAPYVPESTFNIGGQYRFPISDAINGLVRVDYEHRGKQYWDPENSTARSALDLVNARIGIESTNETWSLMASINNATDEEYNSEWVGGGFAHAAPPRIWTVDFRYNF